MEAYSALGWAKNGVLGKASFNARLSSTYIPSSKGQCSVRLMPQPEGMQAKWLVVLMQD